jgi:ribose transport system ATP-binding protein
VNGGVRGSSDPPIIALRGVSKTFGATKALRRVDLSVRSGEVRALLGHNGSGKSTLIKILAGYHEADEGGEVDVKGRPATLGSDLGISFVHQELGLAPPLTVTENLGVQGATGSRGLLRPIRSRQERRQTKELLAALSVSLDERAPVATLSGAERAVLAIARALATLPANETGLLVLDEPTALLAQHEVDTVLAAVQRVQQRGYGVLFVSHRLEEVRRIASTVTVLRDGEVITDGRMDQIDDNEIVRLLVDSDEPIVHRPRERRMTAGPKPMLSVKSLGGTVARDVSFDLYEGEVLGVAGLVGAGHEELPELLAGARQRRSGEVFVNERRVAGSTRRHMRAGIVLLPGDRKRQGGVGAATLRENVSLPSLSRYFRSGWIRRGSERDAVRDMLETFEVRPPEPEALLGQLSGGNQQKALLGKWLGMGASVVILHEPTSGVDVGARSQIIERIKQSAAEGASFVVVSSDFGDLVEMCDRVLICRAGRVVNELQSGAITEHAIASACLSDAT